jgi:hypothetical protein
MSCETYRNALLEAAVGAGELNARVKDHVERCPRCRVTLQQEQTMLAAIDGGLRLRMEEEPRPGFLADVRARISQEPEPRSLVSPRLSLAAASAIVALLIVAVPWATLRRMPGGVAGPTVSTIRIQSAPIGAESRTHAIPHGLRQRQAKNLVVARHAGREAEVLVPPDESEALAKFVTHLRQGDEVARAFASPPVDEEGDLSEIKPLEIARLQLKPLTWESWN